MDYETSWLDPGAGGAGAMILVLLVALVAMLRLRAPPRAAGPPRELWRSAGPGLVLRVVVGDALEVGGDALVIPANRQLTLGWGSHLAELVAVRAGPEVEAEALRAWPEGIGMGEAVCTGAGTLPGYRAVIHAAVLDRGDLDPRFLLRLKPRTSPETLRAAVAASLDRAEEAGLETVVLTPMGAGIGGLSDAACAREIREAVAAWEEAHSGSAVREVAVACVGAATAAVMREGLGGC